MVTQKESLKTALQGALGHFVRCASALDSAAEASEASAAAPAGDDDMADDTAEAAPAQPQGVAFCAARQHAAACPRSGLSNPR